jgi:amino acid adenylation domain-containing protein
MLNTLFKNHYLSHPERPALNYKNQIYSYKELNQRSNQLAHYLKSKAVKSGTIVALISTNYLERIVSIIALWKLGAAYLPIDPNYPIKRINFIIQDSKVNFIITDKEIYQNFFLNSAYIPILLDDQNTKKDTFPTDDLSDFNDTEAIAYIAYTSGSTGSPKGVSITHGNIASVYDAWEQVYDLTYRDRHLQIANFGFDVCSGDIIRAIGSGSQLVICPTEVIFNPEKLYHLLKKEAITIAEFTPVILRKLIQYLKTKKLDLHFMRLLICGSDAWSLREYKEFKSYLNSGSRLINSYGTTEATIDSTYFELNTAMPPLNDLTSVPLGKPFPNTKVKILNEKLEECPTGVQGEIYIGGSGVSLGYLNQPELTQQKFISLSLDNKISEVFYKTGDAGYYLTDGNIVFLGRMDAQSKIMGLRINLIEIENTLNSYQNIEKAIVLPHSSLDATEQFLVAHIRYNKKFKINEYIDFLKNQLPSYSIPAVYFPLGTFPVSPHGKVDRLKLSNFLISSKLNNQLEIESDVEKKLLARLQLFFNIPSLNINNFFYINTNLLSKLLKNFKLDESKFDLNKFETIHTVSDLSIFLDIN